MSNNDESKNITVKIPLSLLKEIKETANRERRSVSSEIVYRLDRQKDANDR